MVCSHNRAYLYYAETVYLGRENNFLGVSCNSMASYRLGNCGNKKAPMGINADQAQNEKGNYYLDTFAQSPFGANRQGRPTQRVRCKSRQAQE